MSNNIRASIFLLVIVIILLLRPDWMRPAVARNQTGPDRIVPLFPERPVKEAMRA